VPLVHELEPDRAPAEAGREERLEVPHHRLEHVREIVVIVVRVDARPPLRRREGGELAGFFASLPAWLGVEEKSDFEKYFDVLQDALKAGRLQPFADGFPEADWSDRFLSEFLSRDKVHPELQELVSTAGNLADIYLRNLDSYRQEVWGEAQMAMYPRTNDLSEFFSERDYIGIWERFLGLEFAADAYNIVICFANKNGPDYNSLGYSGNLFYYDKPFDRTWQFVSHEIGTHLLIDTYFKLARSNKYEHRKLYSAYETLAMFYNRMILGLDKLAYQIPQMNDRWHLQRYAELYERGIGPEALLVKLLEGQD
jgi:hypothetical protein